MGSYRTLSEGQEWSSKPAIAGTMPGSSNNTVRGRSSRGVTKRFVATALASVIRSTFATAEIPELHYESPRYKMLQSNSSRGDAEKSHLPDAGNKGIVKLEVGEILEELSILESQKSTVKSSYSAFRRMLLQFQSPIIEELYFRRDLLYGAVIIIRSSALLNVFTVATIFGFFRSGTWYEQPIWISLLAAIGILSLAYLSAAIWKDGYALVQLAFVSDFGRTIMVALNAVSSIFFPIVDFCLSKNPFDVVGPFATVVIIAECSLSGISASFREMLFHFSLVMSISGVKAIYIALSWRNALGAFLYVIPILMCNLLVIESLYYQDKKRRTTFLKAELAALQLEELEAERKRTEHLLSLVLPPSVVEELRKIRVMKFETVAHWMESGTVMFMDLKNFTQLSERLESKQDAVLMLNMIFQKVDEVLTKFPEIERVKTIKSKLLLLGGLKSTNHLARMIDFALAIRRTFRDKVIFEMPSKIHPKIMRAHLKFGFGLQTGSLMTGIVGKRVFCFEVYGDTVNTASRMLSIAKGHQIIVPAELWCKVCERYRGESIGQRFVKGKGFMDIYSVEGSSSDGIHQQQSLFSAPTKDEGEMDLGAGEGGESSMLKVSKLATPRIDPIIISRVSKSSSSASLDPNRIPSNRGSSIPRASIIECVDESAESSNEGTLQKPFQSGRKPSRTGVHREPSWTSARLGRIFPVDNSSSPPSVDAAGFTGRSNQSSDAANGVRRCLAESAFNRS
ncbi:hypothetical protein DFJ73DRAFT_109416 [Zopfochytrium polystomum]|nr:hypothetical protein DFJ73DRAFT_109416 [Zopfochytrium polystomum]